MSVLLIPTFHFSLQNFSKTPLNFYCCAIINTITSSIISFSVKDESPLHQKYRNMVTHLYLFSWNIG